MLEIPIKTGISCKLIDHIKSVFRFCLFWMVLLSISACQTIPKESEVMKEFSIEDISAYELRIVLNDFAIRFAYEVEQAADQIIAQTDDSDIHSHALLWKMNVIPASQRAAFLPDPLVAFADIWTLCIQMREYFTVGAGRYNFGGWQSIAIETSLRLEKDVIMIAKRVRAGGEISVGESLTTLWASKNPITGPLFIRKSISDTLATLIENKNRKLSSTVGDVSASVQNLQHQLTIYFNHLTKQARWEAEYMMIKIAQAEDYEKSLANLDTITNSINFLVNILKQSPEILDSVGNSMYTFVDYERIETIKKLRQERVAILEALQAERMAIFTEIDRQRIATITELNLLAQNTILESKTITFQIIDHLFWRIIQVMGGILIIIILYIVIRKREKKKIPV
jgi:hypothetical protein